MAYSIEQLKSTIGAEGGLARPTLYAVQLPPFPGGARASTLNLLTTQVSIPNRQMNTMDRNIGGYKSRVANGNITDDITMTFQLTNTGSVQAYFEAWQDSIWNKDTRRAGYFNEYAKRITIKELSMPKRDTSRNIGKTLGGFSRFLPDVKLGPLNANFATGTLDLDFGQNTVREITLEKAYPTVVTGREMGDAGEGFMQMQVVFTYSEWYSKTGLGGLAAGFIQF